MNDIINNIYNNFIDNKLKIELLNDFYLHDKLFILNKLLDFCNNKIIYYNGFKKLYYYSLYNYIIFNINNIINNNYDDDELNYFIKKLILKLITLYKGQILLEKLNFSQQIYLNYFINAAYNGNIHTFNFFLNKINFNLLSLSIKEDILLKSINNNDNRIFKNILDYYNFNNLLNDNLLIHKIINKISIKNNNFNKINILLKYINIDTYYNKIIISFKNIDILINLNKYYNNTYNFNLLKLIYENYDLWKLKNFNNIKTILKNNKEHIILNIIDNLINNNPHENLIINTENIHHIINNNDNILLLILDYFNIFTFNKNIILSILISNNLINDFIYNQIKIIFPLNTFFKFFLYSKFFDVDKIYNNNNNKNNIFYNKIILLNKFLHKLRLKLKYKYNNNNNKIIDINLKNKLLNEILTYKPNNKINILKNGSLYYQNIINYNNFYFNYKDYTNIYFYLPLDIYPKTDIIFNYPIISKYIEEYDIYIIYDIYIPDYSYTMKYNLLKNIHPKINDFKSFILENITPKWFPMLKNI